MIIDLTYFTRPLPFKKASYYLKLAAFLYILLGTLFKVYVNNQPEMGVYPASFRTNTLPQELQEFASYVNRLNTALTNLDAEYHRTQRARDAVSLPFLVYGGLSFGFLILVCDGLALHFEEKGKKPEPTSPKCVQEGLLVSLSPALGLGSSLVVRFENPPKPQSPSDAPN